MLQGGRLLPLGPKWDSRGGAQRFWAARGPSLGRAQKKMGPRGGVFGRPEVTLEGLGPILKMLKNHWFLLCLEPLGPPGGQGGPKSGKKGAQ